MLRDPFYRQILKALEGHLDHQVFERCMGDILRPDFPGLVPVPGGGDSGFDGIIPDDEAAFSLICTTAEDVERNLARSLDSVVKRGWLARKVALATAQALTPPRRLALFDKALEKGFRMMQVFDRTALADRLYRNSAWCKELLLLDGRPSPLSVVPLTRRPLIDLEPVGRQKDLEWIEGLGDDRVLAGEPGSGKTHLLRYLMLFRSWSALFLVSRDFDGGAIRNALADLEPRIVVVDDAHGNLSDLERLVQLRREIGGSFHIVATTWKGAQDEVMVKLGVSPAQIRRLELLTRDEIVEIFKQVGVRTDNDRLRLLVNQAANKPGLAVTIASLWLQGRWDELIDGSALSRDLLTFFHEFVGRESTDVLAAFSLGGDRGMTQEAVGKFLDLARHDLRRITVGLAAGGALREVDGETLAVWPRELRNPLLRVVFFPDSAARLPYRELLPKAPSQRSALETLVNAKLFGVPVSGDELRELIAEAGSVEAWRGMAYLGEVDALWVLERYPGDVVNVAGAALSRAGEAAILRLLQRAETASGQPHSHTHHPIRILQDWVQELDIPLDEMVRRRKLLARISQKYLRAGGVYSVGLQGISLALSPCLEGSSSDPGAGKTINLRWALLPLEQLREVASVWTEVRGDFGGIEAEDWQHLSSILWNWMHPSYASKGKEVPEETEQFMRSFAAEVLRDVVPTVQGKPGLTAKIKELAEQIEVDLNLKPDPVFDLFFPSMDSFLEDLKQREAAWTAALGELATRWSSQEPDEVAELLASYERAAQGIGRAWPPRGDSEVCRRIAALTKAPEAWLDALLSRGASGALIGPFLERIVEVRHEGWERQVERFLALDHQHAWSAVEAVLRLPSPPAHLLKLAFERLSELPQLLDGLCITRQVPIETLKKLFHDTRWEITLTAAVGEWNADQEGGVRSEVAADWSSAILGAKADDAGESLTSNLRYWLGVILAKDPDLALAWLTARLWDAERVHFIAGDDPFGLALSALKKEQRLQLVKELEKGRAPTGFVGLLVGKDRDVFEQVLSSEALRSHHLEPLGFMPDAAWVELALLALGVGHEPEAVVRASLVPRGRIHVQWGSGLEEWQKYGMSFAQFEEDSREEVRRLALLGRQLAAKLSEKARTEERQTAIHGV